MAASLASFDNPMFPLSSYPKTFTHQTFATRVVVQLFYDYTKNGKQHKTKENNTTQNKTKNAAVFRMVFILLTPQTICTHRLS